MKIWIDAQLSPAFAAWINRTFEDITADSIRSVGLRDHWIMKYLNRLAGRIWLL